MMPAMIGAIVLYCSDALDKPGQPRPAIVTAMGLNPGEVNVTVRRVAEAGVQPDFVSEAFGDDLALGAHTGEKVVAQIFVDDRNRGGALQVELLEPKVPRVGRSGTVRGWD